MNVSDQFPHLLRSPVFEDMGKSEIRGFLNNCSARNCRSKTKILEEGHAAPNAFIVAHGKLDIFTTNETGAKVLLHRANPGEIVGDLEIVSRKPCMASCQTVTNTTLIVCSEAVLFQTMSSQIFMRNLAKIQYLRLERANKFKVVDSSLSIRQRICAYLLYLADSEGLVSDNQTFLAELIGCTRQTINRELGYLRDQNLINVTSRQIIILDQPALQTIAGISTE